MTDSSSSQPLRRIRSFVLRTGRMTKGQEIAFEQYWPQFGLTLADGPLDTAGAFGRRRTEGRP